MTRQLHVCVTMAFTIKLCNLEVGRIISISVLHERLSVKGTSHFYVLVGVEVIEVKVDANII